MKLQAICKQPCQTLIKLIKKIVECGETEKEKLAAAAA